MALAYCPDSPLPDLTLAKRLKAESGESLRDCKKALIRAGNDYPLALSYLADILKTI